MLNKTTLFLISISFTLLLSCDKKKKEEENNTEDFDRSSLLSNIGENIIKHRYERLNTSINTLESTIVNITSPININQLETIRSAFKDAYQKWQGCSSFEFGPAANSALRATLNTFPSDTTQINTNITAGGYNLGTASNIVATGFPALDFLLFNKNNSQAQIDYFNNASNGTNRITYLKDIATQIKASVNAVNQEWQTNYVTTFKNANGTDVGSSLSLLINSINLDFEKFIRDGKVGIPLGVRSLGTALPTKTEAYYSGESLILLEESIISLQNIFNGKGELTGSIGLDDYLNHLNTKHGDELLSSKINTQFSAIIKKIDLLNHPINKEVVNNQAAVQNVYNELQKLIVLLKVDLSSALSILITYQDNDGD